MPTISVIVPVYKVEPFLHRCVDSILAQTFTDFELILVDDGSPDNCGAICDEYAAKDSRIHVIHQQNGGLSAARNAGIDWAFAHSDSQWITFVDSDDVVSELLLEYLFDMAQTENADIISCSFQEFSTEDSTFFIQNNEENIYRFSGRDACQNIYEDHCKIGISAWGKFYRKHLFERIRFPVGKIHEDQAVIPIILYQVSKVVASDKKLYYYRKRPQSIMHEKFSNRRFDDLEAVDNCILFFSKLGEIEIIKRAQRRKRILKATYNLHAIIDGVHNAVPPEHKMSELSALMCLQKELSDDKYTYQLAKVHPNWLLPHAYLRKIKKILHIPCQ